MSNTEKGKGGVQWTFVDGVFTREGVVMARMENGEPVFTAEGQAYRAVVLKRLKAQAGQVAAVVVPEASPTASAGIVDAAVVPDDIWSGLSHEVREAMIQLRREQGFDPFHVEPRVKKPVKLDRFVGDKSSAFILDLLRYDPVAFASRYGVERCGRVERIVREVDKNRVMRKVRKIVDVVLSRRKTQLTERVDSLKLVDEDVSNE